MHSYFIYYTEASIVCIIIFAIMLCRDLLGVDRQEKQIKYDRALVAFMLYFACDALWAAIIAGRIPRNHFTVLSTNFGNYIFMAGITYMWLRYVMALEHVKDRDSRRVRLGIQFPFYIATAALVVTYCVRPSVLLDENLNLQPAYNPFQIAVPCVYIAAVIVYTMRRAIAEENHFERRKHLIVGFFPLMVVIGGLAQILLLPETPVFCFASTILMLLFYIHSMETQISTDPLTGLNNRNQLMHYTQQKSNLHRDGRMTFVIMMDINSFKGINDTYGHAEGDRALVLTADSLRSVLHRHSAPMFLARFGGDEFILIVHPTEAEMIDRLIGDIHEQLAATCREAGTPYTLDTSAGYSQLSGGGDTFQACLQRADENLYVDKALRKSGSLRKV